MIGEIFRSNPGLVSWLSWLVRGAASIFKKNPKIPKEASNFFLFSGKDLCFFLWGLFGGTYTDGSPKKPPGFFVDGSVWKGFFSNVPVPVTLSKIVDYNHISPEKSRR